MPVRRGLVGAPQDYVSAKGSWPQGPFRKGTPRSVYYAAHIAKRLGAAIADADITHTAAAAELEVARATLYDVLAGRTFPDLHTIVKAEAAFGTRLWPEARDLPAGI